MIVKTQVFKASGPYMPSPGLTSLLVECIGGGGGGGGAGEPTATEVFAGAGGGSGGYSRIALPAALVAGGVNVTVGVGGTFGGNNNQGGTGGATTFGALCVANGGTGGWAMFPNVVSPQPGNGGPVGVGDVTFPGSGGSPGMWLVFTSGSNYSSSTPLGGQIFGGTVGQMTAPTEMITGPNGAPFTGAGGSGGTTNQLAVPGSVSGGNGGSGICIVTEYCWGDTGDDCLNPPIRVDARVALTREPWPGPGPCPPGWGSPHQLGYDGDD